MSEAEPSAPEIASTVETQAGSSPVRAQVLARAARELHAAQLLAADALAGPSGAASHLWALWRCLAWLSHGEVPESPGESLARWLAPGELDPLAPELREQLHATLIAAHAHAHAHVPKRAESLPPLPPARALLAELRTLGQVLRRLDDREAERARARLRWLARGLGVAVLGALVITAIWRPWQRGERGPWRAAFYPSKSFEGAPDMSRVADIDFDWGQEPPTESIPNDFYSARFDTCLSLDEAREVAFMLVSDNGSRLFIDGELRVDNWAKRAGPSVKGGRVTLDAGVHHLRVEYFEDRREAQLHLSASFEPAQTPGPIPSAWLHYPGRELGDPDPCAE